MTIYATTQPAVAYYNRVCFAQDVAPNDYPVLSVVTKSVSGTIYDSTGATVPGATVLLARHGTALSDFFFCQVTTADGSGNFSFTRDFFDPNTDYWIIGASGTMVKIHGTSDWGLSPT